MIKRISKYLLGNAIVLLLFFLYFLWDARGASQNSQEITEMEISLIRGKCSGTEQINRNLLQQSWFYDEKFNELAGAFGTYGFTLYEQNSEDNKRKEGSFCIEGNNLYVRYFDRRFVPVKVRLFEGVIEYGTKIKPLDEDLFTIKELNKDIMVILIRSDGKEKAFYRKN
ncbi:MAG: hypothetical protein ACPHLK_06755 [Gammaproteobacteria bacterium]